MTNQLATREQIMGVRHLVTPDKDVGMVLVEQGVLPEAVYRKLIAFIRQNQAQTEAKEEVAKPQPVIEVKPEIRPVQAGSLDAYLSEARKQKASDIHITPENPVTFRRFGKLVNASESALSSQAVEQLIRGSIDSEIMKEFDETSDIEFVHSVEGDGRYRASLMRERYGITFSARVVGSEIASFETSGLPPSCLNLIKWTQGMVLVTGPVGSGKTTSMAVLLEMINQERHEHIITIEDPIEILYEPKLCQITQREVGTHTESQASALRGALRQDPDVLIISELRDLESMQLAVSAAETGHLVLATMNTTSASRTIYRLIDSFPPDERQIIRNMVSESLRGVISQQLIPLKDGSGMVPAFEVLIVNKAISNLIRKDNAHMIGSAMVTGRAGGMVLLDDSLETLVNKGLIDGREAFYRAINPKNFAKYVASDGQTHLSLLNE